MLHTREKKTVKYIKKLGIVNNVTPFTIMYASIHVIE